jgi:hypothetical protein
MDDIFGFLLLFALFSMAVANLSDLLTSVDLLDRPREGINESFPRVGKIAIFKYCQSWWMSGASSPLLVFWAWPEGLVVPQWASIVLCWFAIHMVARTLHRVDDGWPIVFPQGVFVISNNADDNADEEEELGTGDDVPGVEDSGVVEPFE